MNRHLEAAAELYARADELTTEIERLQEELDFTLASARMHTRKAKEETTEEATTDVRRDV